MPRHILTPEERLKGGKASHVKLVNSGKVHKLTSADSRKGALAVHAYARTIGVHHGHALTLEDRRRGGLATAAKRRKERERALITLALPAKRGSESLLSNPKDWVDVIPVADLPALGASLAGKLMEPQPPGVSDYDTYDAAIPADSSPEPIPPCAAAMGYLCAGHARGNSADAPCDTREIPQADPFTLSALKRFLPGPRSPLSLTRSQRAHVDIMRREGYLMADRGNMLALTEKGRQAVEESEVSDV